MSKSYFVGRPINVNQIHAFHVADNIEDAKAVRPIEWRQNTFAEGGEMWTGEDDDGQVYIIIARTNQ